MTYYLERYRMGILVGVDEYPTKAQAKYAASLWFRVAGNHYRIKEVKTKGD